MILSKAVQNQLNETVDTGSIDPHITADDERFYLDVISNEISEKQKSVITSPKKHFPAQKEILAIHWHPETIPLDLISTRIQAMFPNAKHSLIIPTQHNELMSVNEFCGVEVDCYSKEFNRKVQLLIHFSRKKEKNADTLKKMLRRTFKYRATQLFEFLDTLTDSQYKERLEEAAEETGASENIVEFSRIYARKLKHLLKHHKDDTRPDVLKNKMIRDFIDHYRGIYTDTYIDRVQIFLQTVKLIVKRGFKLGYFYRTQEIIEEAKKIGAGVVVPHPEQFWPILLADYPIDGFEVWNPQSREYTEFLIQVVRRKNNVYNSSRRVLIFMGDDCHMGEKLKPVWTQNQEKNRREIGLQPAWDDPVIKKTLSKAGFSRKIIIEEYVQRIK